MLSDKELLKQFKKHKHITEYGLSEHYVMAREAHRFYDGDKMAFATTVNEDGSKRSVVFNKVKPFIDAVSGFMRQLRRNPEYNAKVDDNKIAQMYSTYLNGAANAFRRDSNADFMESAQDKEMLITGIGALDTNILYENNPDGQIASELVQYDDLGWDPESMVPNLLDARWMYRRKKYSLEEALKRFKGSKPTDFAGVEEEMNKYYIYNQMDGIYNKIATDKRGDEPLVEIYYYQWWELEKYYRANNPLHEIPAEMAKLLVGFLDQIRKARMEVSDKYEGEDLFVFDPTAETLSMTPQIKNDVAEVFAQFGIPFETQEYLKKCYYTAMITDNSIFQKTRAADQNGFTIKCKTADYDQELGVWYGMVRQLQEPARYANKALTEILYVIAYNSKGGVMYEKSAVDDPARFEREYSTTKSAIRVNDGAISGGQIMPKAQAALPTGYEQVYEISNSSMTEVSGINREFLGSSENRQATALLESKRVKQVVSTLANLFDAITLFQIEQAKYYITLIKILAENCPGRLIRITGIDGQDQITQLNKDRFVPEYDIQISEAPASSDEKQETTTVMMTFADRVAAMGQNVYPFIVDYLPIKYQDKQKLKAYLNPPQSPQEQQQKQIMQQLQLQGHKAGVEKTIAEVQEKHANTGKHIAETAKIMVETHQADLENKVIEHLGGRITNHLNDLDKLKDAM